MRGGQVRLGQPAVQPRGDLADAVLDLAEAGGTRGREGHLRPSTGLGLPADQPLPGQPGHRREHHVLADLEAVHDLAGELVLAQRAAAPALRARAGRLPAMLPRSRESHGPLLPTFHAERAPIRINHPAKDARPAA